MAKSCEQNLKMLANDAILPLHYVQRFVGVCQLSNWDRPEDANTVATPLCCMSCSYVGVCQLSNWARPEDANTVANLPLWMFCVYLCRSMLASIWEKDQKITEVAVPLLRMFCSYVGL